MKGRIYVVAAALSMLLVLAGQSPAQEAKNIEDNSFLIEEAYNQERGVVQHIQAFEYMKDYTWAYTFTQEWPVPDQTHQLSYTIPYLRIEDNDRRTSGFGDIQLNYRYQLVTKERVAVAPRFSVLLPTGDYKRSLGAGTVGYQGSIPVSIKLSDRFVTHLNFGATYTPRARGTDGSRADLTSLNYGASIVWLTRPNFNVLVEAVGASTGQVAEEGAKERVHSFFISPGVRYAINRASGLQIVPGLAFPVGVGPSTGQYGAFLYLSFEHPFL